MVMSTRRCAVSGVTLTPFCAVAAYGSAARTASAARVGAIFDRGELGKDLASCHDLLRLVVEGDLEAGLDGGDVHAERDGVAVAVFDRGVRGLAAAHALHPVAHVGGGFGVDVSAA